MAIRLNEQSLRMLDSLWLRRHVESHLIFGPISQVFPFGWFFIAVFALNFLFSMLSNSNAEKIIGVVQGLFFVFVSPILLKMSNYRQDAVGWCVIKIVGGLVSFIVLIAGGFVGFFRNQPDAIHLTLLAIIWFPSVEFIPKLIQKQKYISMGRIILTIPVAYLGYQTGNWH